MRLSLLALPCALAALALAAPAAGVPVQRPPVTWLKGEGNFTKAHRSPRSIDRIVVHVTEGAFWSSITWLKSHASHASSHYIVSRRGRIVQLVHESDIAWHAGNWKVNAASVGIEHEGVTASPAGFTDAQYHASARLAAYIARRSLMPIDRGHVIGHAEVPSPFEPGAVGGADAHTDPGPHWNWTRYLRLVRRYAYPKPKPRPKLAVASTTIYTGQTLAGRVPWRAAAKGPGITRVDFLVDGKLRWRDRTAPFAFARGRGLDTRALRNGRHVLELRAYGREGAWTRKRLAVRVVNAAPLALSVAGVRDGAKVRGVVPVRADVRGPAVRIVELLLDGKRIDHDRSRPFLFKWDTRRAADGAHRLELVVRSKDGRTAREAVLVVVANPPELTAQTLVEGQTVAGVVDWRAEVRGPVARVELLVDGVLRGTATGPPWQLAWDTAAEADGPHRVTARAVAADGRTAEASITVVVANSSPPPSS